ncbi:MAG: type III pantothenate kinase [Gammaproteobacteria bacterium]|nr:MAG: type III pantothenate kinase [Gammaproteobacteria bacterium]
MKLLVDLGNTRIKWCEYSGHQCTLSEARAYEPATFDSVLGDGWSGNETPASVVLCNVAGPEIGRQLADWVAENWACPVDDLRSGPELAGITNAYADPERLGIDRLVAMVGARSLIEGPVCVVDVGTAATLDAVDSEGRHLGGLIAPGPEMMLTTLGQTGDILLDREGGITEFADATPDAVASGVMLSSIALIERFVAATRKKVGGNVTLVVTGGAGHRMLSYLNDARFETDLVLQGLAVIARE